MFGIRKILKNILSHKYFELVIRVKKLFNEIIEN
jgi:hypothetical protein